MDSKRVTANQNPLFSQLTLKTTSFKREQKSYDARSRPGEIPSNEIYLKVLEAFELANHKTIT